MAERRGGPSASASSFKLQVPSQNPGGNGSKAFPFGLFGLHTTLHWEIRVVCQFDHGHWRLYY